MDYARDMHAVQLRLPDNVITAQCWRSRSPFTVSQAVSKLSRASGDIETSLESEARGDVCCHFTSHPDSPLVRFDWRKNNSFLFTSSICFSFSDLYFCFPKVVLKFVLGLLFDQKHKTLCCLLLFLGTFFVLQLESTLDG